MSAKGGKTTDKKAIVVGGNAKLSTHYNKSILDFFSEASETSINLEKSQIFFFNMSFTTQHNITRIPGFLVTSFPSKYVVAPLFDSVVNHSSYREILDKLETHHVPYLPLS